MQLSDSVIISVLTFLFFIIIALIFKNTIKKAKKVKISLTGIEFEASGDEFARLFEKTYSYLLKREHIEFFRELFEYESPPIVNKVIPGFNRDSEEWNKSKEGKKAIGMLRALRGLGFIEPKGGGRWKSGSTIVLTEFGKEFNKHLK
ncbi:MAG: hypothetical protein OEQ53_05370 [Saprospiraceae bacterium]|nr:hypothetical protein [Saprospiraceae bacterium]